MIRGRHLCQDVTKLSDCHGCGELVFVERCSCPVVVHACRACADFDTTVCISANGCCGLYTWASNMQSASIAREEQRFLLDAAAVKNASVRRSNVFQASRTVHRPHAMHVGAHTSLRRLPSYCLDPAQPRQ